MTDRPVALITGAAGGLGRVLAADLAADGWQLALFGSNAERLAALEAELGLDPEQSLRVAVDLREAGVGEACREAFPDPGSALPIPSGRGPERILRVLPAAIARTYQLVGRPASVEDGFHGEIGDSGSRAGATRGMTTGVAGARPE